MSKASVTDIATVMDKIRTLTPEQTDDGLLDEAVHQLASEQASAANNGGFQSQVIYLLENGYTVEDVMLLLDDTPSAH